jgi:adenylate cyclase
MVHIGSILSVVVIEQSDKRFVKELFGRYISPQVAREVVSKADVGELNLEGEQREVTVLFADIRNFTRISDSMAPNATVRMLNASLAVVMDAVIQNGGMVNKFGGDNVMAVWNAPQSQPKHARLAVKAAWEAQQNVDELRQIDPRLRPVQFGIGVNTGKAIAGSIGSMGRAEYTVIGDTINLASRYCGGAPGGQIWIGDTTYELVREDVEVKDLGPQEFKGKKEPVRVYQILKWHP